MAKGNSQKQTNGSALEFEAQLWATAGQAVPASNLEGAEYNSARPEGLVLGLIFLKYISDAYEEKSIVQVLISMLELFKGRVFEAFAAGQFSPSSAIYFKGLDRFCPCGLI